MKIREKVFGHINPTHRLVIIVGALVGSSATAQSWTNRYNGPGNEVDEAKAIAVDNSGNVYVTGISYGDRTDYDFATIKYSSAGALLWARHHNGPGNEVDAAEAIAVDSSGNVYVTGASQTGVNYDYATVKYSSAGLLLWTRFYDGPMNDRDTPSGIAVDSSGNVYVTGDSRNTSPSDYDNQDYATVAYSSAGVPLWSRRYDSPANGGEWATAIAVDDGSGNVYVTGTSYVGPVFGDGSGDYATVAYTSTGVPLWTRRHNGPGNGHDAGAAIAVDRSGNVYVTGVDSPTTTRYRFDYFTIAYTSSGVLRWSRRYSGPGGGSDEATAIAVDGSGNVYVTGSSPSSGGDSDFLTVAYTGAGVSLWTNRYNGPNNVSEYASDIAVDNSGNVFVTGISTGGDSPAAADYLTVAYTSGGMPLWSRRYNGSGNGYDCANAIAVDGTGSLYVTGQSTGSGGDMDYATVKYVPPLVDHFTYSTISSPAIVNVPLSVTITAKNLFGSNFASFTDTVTFSGQAPGLTATNLTLGSDTDSWNYPMYTAYHDARTQVIYPASELGLACTLNSLAIEVTTAPGQALESWTIRMKHTSRNSYPASPEWEDSDWTLVYQGDELPGGTGWRTFQFSTPFEYNGTDSLLVDFSFNNASFSTDGQCRSTDMGSYRSITFVSDSKDGDPLTWSGTSPTPTRSYNVPNLVLGATYPDLLTVAISPANSGPFVNGVWNGEVTVHEAVSNLVLRAHTGEGVEGESNPFDVEAVVIDTDGDGLDDSWELAWFPSLTNIAFQTDWDGDGFRDGFECAAGTSPIDPDSYLGITSLEVNEAGTEAVIRWSSESNKLYAVHVGSNLVEGVSALLDEHIPATPPVNTYTDTLGGAEMRSYGVEVGP